MTIGEIKDIVKAREVTRLETFYSDSPSLYKALEEIESKAFCVEAGISEFSECEKILFNIICKTFEK